MTLAEAKALAVAAMRPGCVVLGADTVVALDGQLIGKPRDEREATAMLDRLRGRQHHVITGVALSWRGALTSGVESTAVTMRRYTEHEVRDYVASGSPLDKAGAYGIQDRPFAPVADYWGCYLNVVGLPLCLTGRLLREAEVQSSVHAPLACSGHTPGNGLEGSG